MRRVPRVLGLLLATAIAAGPALSQEAPGTGASAQPATQLDPNLVPMPDLRFVPNVQIERNYGRYYYFHREGTDYATAYADLRECDAYARGISLRLDGHPLTGPVTGALVDAVFGSAQRRDISRRNMRVCMQFKEYRRYGLPRSLWEQISFEPGSRLPEEQRQRLLQVQARIASGPRPQVGEIAW